MGENIGAAARGMLNFGFSNLRIVNPRDGWPNQAAISMAVGAKDVVEQAKLFPNLEEAIADLSVVYATTSKKREMNKTVISAENLYNDIISTEENPAKIGIVFGAERTGLDNDELVWANKIISIEVNEDFKTLNLATSVAIICYELRKLNDAHYILPTPKQNSELASQGEIENLFKHIENLLDQTNFYQVLEKKPTMLHNIKNIFKRVDKITIKEVNTLIGIFKSMQ